MKKKVFAAVALTIIVLAGAALWAKNSPTAGGLQKESAKISDIRKLMQMTGATAMGTQMIEEMVGRFKTMMPNVSAAYWDEMMREVNTDALLEMIIPVYDRNLTHDEVKEILKFYESPVGKKLISIMPVIQKEAVAAGQEWGRKLGENVAKKLMKDREQMMHDLEK